MDFYQRKDEARGRTTQLLILYALAVLGLGAFLGGAVHLVLSAGTPPNQPLSADHWSLVATSVIVTWGVILLGSSYKLLRLGRGGSRVAEMLGGRLISSTTEDEQELRCVHVVEEMAIAAGLPVPPLYLLPSEAGINAFAAGWSHDDAVIGVTRGALENLNREQLQGVIAHEFSHILNRDCSLNMRLLGVLHGIVLISILGRVLTRIGSGGRRSGLGVLVLAGIALWVMGSLGALLARLIQAAVSRQREYLADASAVQFTRNPAGLAGALATIGTQTSSLASPRGQETSHMLFGDPSISRWTSFSASHPPLEARISRILPSWSGNYSDLLGAQPPTSDDEVRPRISSVRRRSASGFSMSFEGSCLSSAPPPPPDSFHTGRSSDDLQEAPAASTALKTARELLSSVPRELYEAAHSPFSARALILTWLIDADPENMMAKLALLADDERLQRETERLAGLSSKLEGRLRLPLFDLALASLQGMSPSQAQAFLKCVQLMEQRLSPHAYRAYCLAALTRGRLDPRSRRSVRPLLIKDAIEVVLSVLSHQGHPDETTARAAFEAGGDHLGPRGRLLRLVPSKQLDVHKLDAAFATLLRLPINTRAAVLAAAELVASHDEVIEPAEAELLRTMATCLGVGHSPY